MIYKLQLDYIVNQEQIDFDMLCEIMPKCDISGLGSGKTVEFIFPFEADSEPEALEYAPATLAVAMPDALCVDTKCLSISQYDERQDS